MELFRFTNNALDDILRLQRALASNVGRSPWGFEMSGRGVFPPLNLFENQDRLVIKAEVPGFDKESFDIAVQGDRLSLAGKRAVAEVGDRSYHRRERRGLEFRRMLRLPYAVDPDKTVAEYKDGVLTVTLEKAESAKPRQIRLQA